MRYEREVHAAADADRIGRQVMLDESCDKEADAGLAIRWSGGANGYRHGRRINQEGRRPSAIPPTNPMQNSLVRVP